MNSDRVKIPLWAVSSLFLCSTLIAQPFFQEVSSVPIKLGNVAFQFPFGGGINTPNHEFVDIDGDGDFDLFILDRDRSVEFYRNGGTTLNARFTMATGQIDLPSFTGWFRFVDIDADGDVDLFTDDGSSDVVLYENVGTVASPQFLLRAGTLLDSQGNPVYSERSSIPAFTDIDGDGDIDFFSVNASNGTINFYENIGDPYTPLFKFITNFYQNIQIISGRPLPRADDGSMHGTAAMMFADLDDDRDVDLIYGDLFSPGVWFFRNDGTAQSASFKYITNRYPANGPINSPGFNMPTLVDIDGDKDYDLFVGILSAITMKHTFMLYLNEGTPMMPSFSFASQDYISMFDVGSNSHPVFTDIDGDGDLDLIVGNLEGSLTFLRNRGTQREGAFLVEDTAFVVTGGDYALAPTFADIDNDGDQDLFIGNYSGKILFYKNIGSALSPQFDLTPSQLDAIDVGSNCSPVFVDIDADGDMDLFTGKSNGKLSFYRNNGTGNAFSFSLATVFFDSITVSENSQPSFLDIDGDGDFDLFIGSGQGRVFFYRNTGSGSLPMFVREDYNLGINQTMTEAVPAFADLDGDGDRDLILGNSKGGLWLYRNSLISHAGNRPDLEIKEFRLAQNFPNPFNAITSITYSLLSPQTMLLQVADVSGREVSRVSVSGEVGTHTILFNAEGLAAGAYIYTLRSKSILRSKRMMVIK